MKVPVVLLDQQVRKVVVANLVVQDNVVSPDNVDHLETLELLVSMGKMEIEYVF